jgi:predicted RNA-binding Zn ribbon-like protein
MFAHDTELALVVTAALVNTHLNGADFLTTREQLDRFLADHPFTGSFTHDQAELDGVRALRATLREVWQCPGRAAAARLVNDLLVQARALPQLVIHDDLDWHIHATPAHAPLAQRMAAEAAMAFVDVIRTDNLDRLRFCAAGACDAVLVDFSRNRSRRYCDTGNCGNRAHVAAYRARRQVKPR